MLQPISVKATSLSDAWFQMLYAAVDKGRQFKIDQGSNAGQKRCELDFVTIQITHPGALPLLPKVNPVLGFPDPVEEGYLDEYLPYLMTSEEKEGEAYTYGQRICEQNIARLIKWTPNKLFIPAIQNLYISTEEQPNWLTIDDTERYLNQMELMIWTYKNKGHRNNQMVLQVGQPSDRVLVHPPCLLHIDTRIQDGALHFYPYFRSWDLYNGFPANLAAIEMMKQYCAKEIGVENGEIIATSKGLHLYDYVFEIAAAIRGYSIEKFQARMSGDEINMGDLISSLTAHNIGTTPE